MSKNIEIKKYTNDSKHEFILFSTIDIINNNCSTKKLNSNNLVGSYNHNKKSKSLILRRIKIMIREDFNTNTNKNSKLSTMDRLNDLMEL